VVYILNVDLQNVESQNIELQNVDLQNVDKTKRRHYKTSTVTKGRHYKTLAWSKLKFCTEAEGKIREKYDKNTAHSMLNQRVKHNASVVDPKLSITDTGSDFSMSSGSGSNFQKVMDPV
jgi:ABC-type uncharacterized transport system ATPase subunit